MDQVNNRNKIPVPDTNRDTVDNRQCLTSCAESSLPGEPGSPSAPKEADPCKYFFLIFR